MSKPAHAIAPRAQEARAIWDKAMKDFRDLLGPALAERLDERIETIRGEIQVWLAGKEPNKEVSVAALSAHPDPIVALLIAEFREICYGDALDELERECWIMHAAIEGACFSISGPAGGDSNEILSGVSVQWSRLREVADKIITRKPNMAV